MPKVLSVKQLLAKKYDLLPDLPEEITNSFGSLTKGFVMIIYGDSGNGKSNLTMTVLNALRKHLRILYVSYEEGHGMSIQNTVVRQMGDVESGVCFADHTMSLDELTKRLKKKRSEGVVVIDSVQYMSMDTRTYFDFKEQFLNKIIIFISHAKGKKPLGKTACDIEYDATIKVFVKGYVAFIKSRLGGNKPFLIWEEGAKKYWGEKKFNEIFEIKRGRKPKKKEPVKEEIKIEHEETHTDIASI